jgi:hypothetical protein
MKLNQALQTIAVALATATPAPAVAAPAGRVAAMHQPTQLTFSTHQNTAFGQAMQQALADLQHTLSQRLCMPLTAKPLAAVTPPECPHQSQGNVAVLHAVVLRDGVFHRVFSTHSQLLEQPVSLGSVGKAVLAVPLLAHAGALAGEQWCVQAFGGFRNASGDMGHASCAETGAHVSASHAMATSDNLATIWRIRQLPAQQVRQQLQSVGISNVPGDYHPGIAAALGVVTYTPRQALECFDALLSGSAQRAALVSGSSAAASGLAQWCAAAVATQQGRVFVTQMLQAPTLTGGTASVLRHAMPGATALRAKTGTPANASAVGTGKVLLASFSREGRRYTVLLALLSPKAAVPISPSLAISDLRPFLEIINAHTTRAASSPRPN